MEFKDLNINQKKLYKFLNKRWDWKKKAHDKLTHLSKLYGRDNVILDEVGKPYRRLVNLANAYDPKIYYIEKKMIESEIDEVVKILERSFKKVR